MKEIVVIAPFNSMVEITRELVENKKWENIDVVEGDLINVDNLAQMAIDGGAKILISRGGIYERIKATFEIPVVEVKVTAYDLIESFYEVKHAVSDNKVAVIGYANVIAGARIIAGIMGFNASCFEIKSRNEIVPEVDHQIAKGIRVFIGDGNVGRVIETRNNCRFVFVRSGQQAMQNALQQAQEILCASMHEKEMAQQFSTIIDSVHDGIVAVNSSGDITVFNNAAEKLTGINKLDALGNCVSDVIPQTKLLSILDSERAEIGDVQTLANKAIIATNQVPVIVDGEIKGAVATYQDITEVQNIEQKIRIRLAEKGFIAQYTFSDIVHKSNEIRECISKAKKFSNYDISVLIYGPSGVGKELFAQGIHNDSARKKSPFVAINCAALPEALIESELFGYVEGSFSGANKKGKPGVFEMAHRGTIFLDEISELPLLLQGRLLRVLQEKQVMRLGDSKLIPVDVRIICASNRDLLSLVRKKQFRRDLYYRIATLNLFIPSLNNRKNDIELLSKYFVKQFGKRYRNTDMSITDDAIKYLKNYTFMGNVRELQGMIERAVVLSEDKYIKVNDFVETLNEEAWEADGEAQPAFFREQTLEDLEETYIEFIYKKTNGSLKEASEILGIGRSTLWRRVKKNRNPTSTVKKSAARAAD